MGLEALDSEVQRETVVRRRAGRDVGDSADDGGGRVLVVTFNIERVMQLLTAMSERTLSSGWRMVMIDRIAKASPSSL